jgi:hypothetical protein
MSDLRDRSARVARVVAGVAAALFGLRWGGVALAAMFARDAAGPNGAAGSASVAPKGSASAAVADGTPIQISVVVFARAPAAAIRIDGAKLGTGTVLTQTSCKAGEPVVIEIVPPKGAIARHEHPCAPGTIRVDER